MLYLKAINNTNYTKNYKIATMINDDIIRLRALEPEDLECLYKWENDMDLWEVSDIIPVPYVSNNIGRVLVR